MEESAIDMIFEIRELLKSQADEIKLLKQNVAMLNNKLQSKEPAPILKKKKVLNPVTEEKPQKPIDKKKEPVPNTRVFGHLEDSTAKKLSGVVVKFKDDKDRLIKTTKSNTAGLYMAFLPPGKYTAEFIQSGLQSAFMSFKVIKGQKELEIA